MCTYRISRAWLALGLGATGCAAQATDAYQGEALLQLHGQAVVNSLTGGVPINPALCFQRPAVQFEPVHRADLPPEVADRFSPQSLWEVASTAILEVESRGQFPSDFDVAVYLPPPQDAIRPLFPGEPRSARGKVCAVRSGHPQHVTAPIRELQDCNPQVGEPCIKRLLWASASTHRYYMEEYECPKPNSRQEECKQHVEGDPQLAHEDIDFVVGRDSMQVLYLAEPAPADSYLAWHYGASSGLAPGYHVFAPDESDKDYLVDLRCRLGADSRAIEEATRRFEAHLVYYEEQDTSQVDPAYADAFEDERERLFAQYHRESCDPPQIHEVSPDDAVHIAINQDPPTVRLLFP